MVREARARVGTVVERYRLEALLGEGGFGAVYRARHVHMGRRVALKLLHAQHHRSPGLLDRFLREARAVEAAGSEHIVGVYDCGVSAQGDAFLALELLEGEDLHVRLERGCCSVDEAIEIAAQVCAGLGSAHAAGVVHRDLKPANIFLVHQGQTPHIKLLDFGVSMMSEAGQDRLTRTGTVMGTPHYMAPEQIRSARDVDARTDLYALGVVLYQMVSGRFPFDAESYEALVVKIVTEPIRPLSHVAPHVPQELERLVERATARDPDARFQSAADLGRALTRMRAARPAASAAETPQRAPQPPLVFMPTLASDAPPAPTPASDAPPAPLQERVAPAGKQRAVRWGVALVAGLVVASLAAATTVLVLYVLDEGPLTDQAPPAPALGLVTPYETAPPATVASSPVAAAPLKPSAPPATPAGRPTAGVDSPASPDPPVDPAPPAVQPAATPRGPSREGSGRTRVRVHRARIIGGTSAAGLAEILQRARRGLSSCRSGGRAVTVHVQLLVRPDGIISIAQPDPTRDPGDRRAARCVAGGLQAESPVPGGGSGIAFITVDL